MSQLLPIFQFLSVPLHELFSMKFQMLHTLFVHHSFPFIAVVSKMAGFFIFCVRVALHELFTPEKRSIQKRCIEKSERAIILLEGFRDSLEYCLI